MAVSKGIENIVCFFHLWEKYPHLDHRTIKLLSGPHTIRGRHHCSLSIDHIIVIAFSLLLLLSLSEVAQIGSQGLCPKPQNCFSVLCVTMIIIIIIFIIIIIIIIIVIVMSHYYMYLLFYSGTRTKGQRGRVLHGMGKAGGHCKYSIRKCDVGAVCRLTMKNVKIWST